MTNQEAMRLALDALEMPCDRWNSVQSLKVSEAITALRTALSAPAGGDIDEAHMARLRERGAAAWAGVDPQALREWGQPAAPAGDLPPLPEPVAIVTECEACFTPDVCGLRGKCDYYAAEKLRVERRSGGINIERLRRALALAGCAAHESAEGLAAEVAEHVNRLTLALVETPPVPKETQALWDACKKAADAERHACSIVVWMAQMEASEPDADDLGVAGWLEEAETRIKRRAGPPEAPFWPSELRDMLGRAAVRARDSLVSGDFDKARPHIAALASFASTVVASDSVPDFKD